MGASPVCAAPVSFEEFEAFCSATGRTPPADLGMKRGHHPVVNVSWREACDYCRWLAEVTGKPYRLPTEAERAEAAAWLAKHAADPEKAIARLAWALLASTEFCTNH